MAAECCCCGTSVDWWVRLRSHPELPICHNCLGGLNAQRDGQVQLETGAWLVTGFEAVFEVSTVPRAVAFYTQLGFATWSHDARYAFARCERDLTIHLAQIEHTARRGHGTIYLHCQDADRVADEWRGAGIEVDGPLDQEHGKREGSVTDPDGNVVRFGGPLREALPDRIGRAR
jgi:catechol 2,3-dioxygenase-like lactoylglutathione lyase family enzyme